MSAGLTQQALADLSKMSPRTIRDLEAGRATARKQTIQLLADALRLSGLVREVFVHAGLGRQPPAPAGAETAAAVPKAVDALLGRDREVRAMVEALGSGRSRMISISGLPGVGKTRVAAEIASQLSARRGWPVLWIGAGTQNRVRLDISLSPLLRSLHARIARNTEDLASVRHVIRDHEALLVLDGIADVREPAGVEDLLGCCPGIRVVSTSRIPWQVAGFQSAAISPLATPERDREAADLSLDALARVPSARLFLDRILAVRPAFELRPDNARVVAEMCRRLDGLPLALETVARQSRVLSLHQLAEVPVTDLLDLALPARSDSPHETIASLVSWSFERQGNAPQAMLRKLARSEALTAPDVARLLQRRLHEVLDDLSALIGYGLIVPSYGESATFLRIPNLLRAFLLRRPDDSA
jgi:transcriptional regulator with XRE-family HTH domain